MRPTRSSVHLGRRQRPVRRAVLAASAVAITGSLAAACGSSSSAGSTAPTQPNPTPSAAGAATNTLSVTITDAGYRISGTPRPGRIDIKLANQTAHAAEFSFQPLKPGVSAAQVMNTVRTKGFGAVDKLFSGDSDRLGFGEPAIVGAHSTAETITAPVVSAGDYFAASFLPGPQGKPEALDGLVGHFSVAGEQVTAAPTATAGTISLTDRSVTLPSGFTGHGTYAITNTGHARHSLSFARLRGPLPKLFECVGQSFGQQKPIDRCPGTLLGGIDSIRPGGTAYVVLSLSPGHYGYVSTDGNDVAHGLAGTVTVS